MEEAAAGGGLDNQDNNNQEQQDSEYDISILSGTWTGSNGRGTATGYNGTFDLIMTSCSASFSDIQSSGSSATAYVTASAKWDSYQNNRYFSTVIHFDSQNAFTTFEHTGHNTWRYTFPVTGAILTIKLTSETTAEVNEEGTAIVEDSYGSYTYEYSASYNMTKQYDNNNDSSEYNIEILFGRWAALSGSGTATGPDGTFDLSMREITASFGSINHVDDDHITTHITAVAQWAAYQDNKYIRTIDINYDNEFITVEHIGVNTWRYTFQDTGSTVTAKITSETTAEITEEGKFYLGSYLYNYSGSYKVTKGTQDNDSSEYDISIISGRWTGSGGTGTAAGSDGTYNVKMEGFTALLSSLSTESSSASVYVTSYMSCGVYQDNKYITTLARDDNDKKFMRLEHTGTNTWSYNPDNSQRKITIRFTSERTAEVNEEGRAFYPNTSRTYNYNISYSVTKQPDSTTPSPDEYDISVISGTWSGSEGSGTAEGDNGTINVMVKNFSATLSNLHASGSSANAYITGSALWDIYRNNEYVTTDKRMSGEDDYQSIIFEHIGYNTWRYITQSSHGQIKFTSPTTAEVTEDNIIIHNDSYTYQGSLSYNVTRQTDNDNNDDDNDIAPSPDPDEPEQELNNNKLTLIHGVIISRTQAITIQ